MRRALSAGVHQSRRALSALASSPPPRPEVSQAERLTSIGTRALFSAEHDLFRENVRLFFEREVAPFHAKWEKEGIVGRDLWLKAGEADLLGVNLPEVYGGSGGDILYSAVMWEEQGYSGCSGPGFTVHCDIVMPYIRKYGTAEQREKYLPMMAKGEWIGAIAMTEPAAGSDLRGMKTNGVKTMKDGREGYVLNGQKTFITNGINADVVIVCAKTVGSDSATSTTTSTTTVGGVTSTNINTIKTKPKSGISLFLVDSDMMGFSRGRNLEKLGLKAQDTAELFFDDVFVPIENVIGLEHKGLPMLMSELPQERLLIADVAVSSAEACFEWTREYAKAREAFGKSLIDHQTVSHKLAEMKTEICVGRAFVDQCLHLHANGRLDTSTASMAKKWMSELQCRVADTCVQLHGGYGYMWEYPVCRAYADARVQRIYGGSNEIMMEIVARDL
mmetsp:Transcript_39416/g.101027  ORF Transcript_39416/g.101027 Transcript_39416/m.101027 type:complete len:446 (-) Transcript_39416:542-1879(-)